jgi:hypothetical protein
MIDASNDRSQPQENDAPPTLDYGHAGIAKKARKMPITGVISFVAILVQFPWAVVCAYLMWLGVLGVNDPSRARVPPSEEFMSFFILALPSLVAVAFGSYSVKVGGITLRNILGVLGVALSAAMLLLPIIEWFITKFHI